MSRQPRCLQSEFIAHLGEIIDLPFLLSLGFVSGKLSHRKRRGARIQFSHEHQDHLSQRKLLNKNVAWIMLLFYRAKWVENGLWNPQKAQITFALKSQLRSCLEASKNFIDIWLIRQSGKYNANVALLRLQNFLMMLVFAVINDDQKLA